MTLRLTSPGRREGQGTHTRAGVLAREADLLPPLLGLGCFLSSARIWMRLRIGMRLGLHSSLLKDLLGRTFPDHIPSAEKSSSRRGFWERPANDASGVAFLCWWMNHFPVPQGKSPSLML